MLRARFNDARFFWDVDLQRPLADRVEDLKNVTFQAKLGSYYEKTERMVALAKEIAQRCRRQRRRLLRVPLCFRKVRSHHRDGEGVHRAAGRGRRPLCARSRASPTKSGALSTITTNQSAWRTAIPSTLEGQVVALADKIDTLRGCFEIGLMPTGSRDPFALRRAAQGVVKILVEGKLRLSVRLLLGEQSRSCASSCSTACATTSAMFADLPTTK